MTEPGPRFGAHDITCAQAVSLMSDFLDGALDDDERGRLEAHLVECEHCTEHLRQIRIAVAVTGHLREEDLEPLAREDLMTLFHRWRGEGKR